MEVTFIYIKTRKTFNRLKIYSLEVTVIDVQLGSLKVEKNVQLVENNKTNGWHISSIATVEEWLHQKGIPDLLFRLETNKQE